MPKFDPIAVGDEIAGHIAKADEAIAANREHSIAAGMLLLEVQENHPTHMEAICDRIKLGRSRRYELLQIAGGRKTLEKSRADNKARQDRHRAKKKVAPAHKPSPLHPPVTDNSNEHDGEGITEPEPKPAARPRIIPAQDPSKVALEQFKFAVKTWLPKMNAQDMKAACLFVTLQVEEMAA